ncbi:hypothetical protein WDJ50_16035 [Deinococcus sp. VB142]|uniref:Uncharacterized protein n=1 Tax=Deinococcus sp. VB142 TaxID=3112952 RepID=A0AAU6Q888_9DEIO
MSVYLIHTDKDGAVAAAYQKAIAEQAVLSLERCADGRVWTTRASGEEAAEHGVEVLLTLEDAQPCDLWQAKVEGKQVECQRLRRTLRGLVLPGGYAREGLGYGRGLSRQDAIAQAEAALRSGTQPPRAAFNLSDILI